MSVLFFSIWDTPGLRLSDSVQWHLMKPDAQLRTAMLALLLRSRKHLWAVQGPCGFGPDITVSPEGAWHLMCLT